MQAEIFSFIQESDKSMHEWIMQIKNVTLWLDLDDLNGLDS